MYYINAELVLKSYIPLELELGMLFVNITEDKIELFELKEIPKDQQLFLKENGAPVEYFVIDENNCILASPNEIGLLDNEETDELYEIDLEDVNNIINNNGFLKIAYVKELYENSGVIVPFFIDEKVVIKY